MNCNMDCKDKCKGTCKKCQSSEPLYLPDQVAAPGETERMDMRGIDLFEGVIHFKDLLEKNWEYRKTYVAGQYTEWYPEKIFQSDDDKYKLDIVKCYIFSPDEYNTVMEVINTFEGVTDEKESDPVSFEVKQFLGDVWAYKNISREHLEKSFPKHAFIKAEPLVWRAFRLYDIRYLHDAIRIGTENSLAYAGRVHGSTDRYLNKLKKAQEVLNGLQISTVVIPYKGAIQYGNYEETNDGLQ